jgi:hypothetical protein
MVSKLDEEQKAGASIPTWVRGSTAIATNSDCWCGRWSTSACFRRRSSSREQIDRMFDILREAILRTMHDVERELGINVV